VSEQFLLRVAGFVAPGDSHQLAAAIGKTLGHLTGHRRAIPVEVEATDGLLTVFVPGHDAGVLVFIDDGVAAIAAPDERGPALVGVATALAVAERAGSPVDDPDWRFGASTHDARHLETALTPAATETFDEAAARVALYTAEATINAALTDADHPRAAASAAGERQPAPLALRAGAAVIDLAFLSALLAIVYLAGVNMTGITPYLSVAGLMLLGALNGLVGATPGKLALGLRVIDLRTGRRLGLRRGIRRHRVIQSLSNFVAPAVIDALLPAVDRRHRSIHDRLSRAMVVRR
jgi:uncharacterized RDD family membrane protein YckC